MELSNQIRRLRAERGLSQDALAKAIFVSRQTVSNWETDKTYPDVQSLVLLSQLFNVSLDELIQGDVAVMRRVMEEDARQMRQLSVAASVLLVLSVVFFVALTAAWRDPSPFGGLTKGTVAGAGVFVPLYALSMACAVWIERIKRRHDLVTYREIVAFANGELLDEERLGHAFMRTHPAVSAAFKFAFAAALGAVVGLVAYKLLG